ncbi:Brl1/Brr6 domain-containing protein, partial [Gorgonomyces haynaldii]
FAVCVGLLIYGAVVVVWTIQHDLRIKQFEFQQEITHQIHECTHQYLKNRCDPETRVPAMELQCLEWQRCMQKD